MRVKTILCSLFGVVSVPLFASGEITSGEEGYQKAESKTEIIPPEDQLGVTFSSSLLRQRSCLYAWAVTGWDVIRDDRSVDGEVCSMKLLIKETPHVLLVETHVVDGKITGKVTKVYKGTFNQGDRISCEAPKNLFKKECFTNRFLPEMYILCKSVTQGNGGERILHDVTVVPTVAEFFRPQWALEQAMKILQIIDDEGNVLPQ